MIPSIALSIFLSNFVILTLAELPADSGQQRLTAQYDEIPSKEVSEILFGENPQQRKVLELLLHDIQRGNHLLLVENRGLENKKIADRLLHHLNRPTEYIQLRRNTTIQSLTVQQNIKNGIIIYEDSPLVKAVKYGYVLVVSEADKASTIVTSSLNTLMANREMALSDGRRMIPKEAMYSSGIKSAGFLPVHENFRMIVLASRTGFPYLEDSSARSEFRYGENGITVKAVGSSPLVTTAVMGGYGTGPHSASAIATGSAVATATAKTFGWGTSTATANAAGSSVATVTAHSYDAGVATGTITTTGSSVAYATAYAHDSGVATVNVNTAGSAKGDASADAYNLGRSTAAVTCTGSSVAGGTARSQDRGIATAIANTAGSSVVKAQAIARGNQVVTDTQKRP
ncbi:unnamed protein product [Parnassius apollo]|uniref:(apollo) hypothetical protein n=1 Tax=Parnassius apollo TaxID=110799 RepID=A0A8S3Y3V7_PARAO|nr:unnamed protein product [Parnassius apollo]